MRFIVYGAGGVGCVIGASLFAHGHQTVLVGNPEHVDKIRNDGLALVTPSKTSRLMIPAAKTAAEIAPFSSEDDVILLAAKSQHTVRCLGQLKNAGAPTSLPIFCCQNSIWNEPMASRIFDRVYGVVVAVPATFLRPGEVDTPLDEIKGHLEVGRYPSGTDALASEVVRCLAESDFDVLLNETVMQAKGAKCLSNLMNPFDAITDTTDPGELSEKVREEATSIWKAAGIEWESPDEYKKKSDVVFSQKPAPQAQASSMKMSSTWQSLARGTGNVESEQINGDVVMLARALGLEAPYNECLWQVATCMAVAKEKPGKYTRADLERMVAERSWPTPPRS